MTQSDRNVQRAGVSGTYAQPRVLPRQLRRPARFAQRLVRGDVTIPKYLEAALLGGFVGFCIVYGSFIGGQLQRTADQVAAAAGFGISEIEISGNTHTRPGDIYRAIGLADTHSLIGVDIASARAAVNKLPWVESAQLRKAYPDTLSIDLVERDPFALWQMGDSIAVVERDGTVIGGFAADPRIAALPLLVGVGAAEHADDFLRTLSAYPWISGQAQAYIRVGDRRWDLRLRNGLTVKLPENGIEAAIDRLQALDASEGVLARDLASIDLRLPDRTVFALTDNAADERAKFVKTRAERHKALKKRGNI
ncbi:MAG: cell division protein FtsQ/DivIB [Pseudomonadota bacterium]